MQKWLVKRRVRTASTLVKMVVQYIIIFYFFCHSSVYQGDRKAGKEQAYCPPGLSLELSQKEIVCYALEIWRVVLYCMISKKTVTDFMPQGVTWWGAIWKQHFVFSDWTTGILQMSSRSQIKIEKNCILVHKKKILIPVVRQMP